MRPQPDDSARIIWGGLRLARARLYMNVAVLPLGKVVIKSTDDPPRADVESLANTQQCPNVDAVIGLDLLPVPQAETERDHIFLSVPFLLA